jgi:hypothetical protein
MVMFISRRSNLCSGLLLPSCFSLLPLLLLRLLRAIQNGLFSQEAVAATAECQMKNALKTNRERLLNTLERATSCVNLSPEQDGEVSTASSTAEITFRLNKRRTSSQKNLMADGSSKTNLNLGESDRSDSSRTCEEEKFQTPASCPTMGENRRESLKKSLRKAQSMRNLNTSSLAASYRGSTRGLSSRKLPSRTMSFDVSTSTMMGEEFNKGFRDLSACFGDGLTKEPKKSSTNHPVESRRVDRRALFVQQQRQEEAATSSFRMAIARQHRLHHSSSHHKSQRHLLHRSHSHIDLLGGGSVHTPLKRATTLSDSRRGSRRALMSKQRSFSPGAANRIRKTQIATLEAILQKG